MSVGACRCLTGYSDTNRMIPTVLISSPDDRASLTHIFLRHRSQSSCTSPAQNDEFP
jgi:hypothetical protein